MTTVTIIAIGEYRSNNEMNCPTKVIIIIVINNKRRKASANREMYGWDRGFTRYTIRIT